MEASRLPTGSQERVSFIRKRAKDYLVTQLAGQITLSQFYRLLTIIEAEAGLYFARHDWSGGKSGLRETWEASPPPPPPPVAGTGKSEALRQALAKVPLPVKGGQAHPRDSGGISPGDRRPLVSPAGIRSPV